MAERRYRASQLNRAIGTDNVGFVLDRTGCNSAGRCVRIEILAVLGNRWRSRYGRLAILGS